MNSIYTIGDGKTFLEPERLAVTAAAAQHQGATTSDRYSFINTMNVLNTLKVANWLPVKYQEQQVKSVDRQGYQKHMIRLRQAGTTFNSLNDVLPELILTNSHDARSAYVLLAGFFRLACLNGLIVSQEEFAAIHITHVGYREEDVLAATSSIAYEIPRLLDNINQYKALTLNPGEREVFAESSLILKYGEGNEETKREGPLFLIGDRSFSIPSILQPRRSEDEGASLWNTYNVVQEKLTKGNRFERTTRKDEITGKITHARKTREIKGIDETLRVNKGLWYLMQKMAEIKKAA